LGDATWSKTTGFAAPDTTSHSPIRAHTVTPPAY
jgi:hypothetical protein